MHISHLEIKTQHDDVRALRALSRDVNDRSQYYVQFVPFGLNPEDIEHNSIKQRTILSPSGKDGTMLSYAFSLKRGLYYIVLEKIIRVDQSVRPAIIERDSSTRVIYPEPVMVGDRYIIEVKKEEAVCYGKKGLRIRMGCRERNLGPRDVYYCIKGEAEDIKYYVPFKDNDRIDFFVKGVESSFVEMYPSNPGFLIVNI